MKPESTQPNFTELLDKAVTEPGVIARAYFAFHTYSLGNQLLAYGQCASRGLEIGPLASFNRWKELGRHVVKGQKAIELCMPITCKRDAYDGETAGADGKVTYARFVFRKNWFVASQTAGAELEPQPLPTWNEAQALAALDITRGTFAMFDGNTQGYATGRTVTISPVAFEPERTLFHEIAHVILGHTAESTMTDNEKTPRDIREVEAESVAMLVCAALGLPGIEHSRGYIQHWRGNGQAIPEASARKIFKAADQILKAGRTETADESAAA